ncbi:CLUMA_CG009488, isoform A [Clunio marinus]|uniref:CLUMA_CG009488, isoform A n=1 Tax=Clunio marinus TaxID=568069 RepID=A0A1J1I7A4_9DIPT|nr:CLUMA_CG009488, isoform A [Clunio marinus]
MELNSWKNRIEFCLFCFFNASQASTLTPLSTLWCITQQAFHSFNIRFTLDKKVAYILRYSSKIVQLIRRLSH